MINKAPAISASNSQLSVLYLETIFEYLLLKSMRYYAEVKKCKYMEAMHRNPYTYFAHDLFYFLCREYELEWTPYEINKPLGVVETVQPRPRTYLPHPESFFDDDMRHGMKCLFKEREGRFKEKYRLLVPEGAENRLEIFVDHVNDIHDRAIEMVYTPGEMYHVVAYLGRLSALFYGDGCRDAGFLAPALIADGLWRATYSLDYRTVFRLMNESAIRSIDKFYLSSGIFLFSENDYNCDESEDDYFDEPEDDYFDEPEDDYFDEPEDDYYDEPKLDCSMK